MRDEKEPPRTVEEVRAYLIRQLNLALRRPAMYGGESALRLFLDAVAFVDRREQVMDEEIAALRSSEAYFPTGVKGAVKNALGHPSDDVTASVYAEVAHRQGWLVLDIDPLGLARLRMTGIPVPEQTRYSFPDGRVVTTETLRHWCRHDRTQDDVLAEFGPPSLVFGSFNPNWPKTFAYGTGDGDHPFVFFHLWNGPETAFAEVWEPAHAQPVLLAARRDGRRFLDAFLFTPYGAARRTALGADEP